MPNRPLQHFPPPRPIVKSMGTSGDDFILIAEGHLHARLFPALPCPWQVDLTGQHWPWTSWIMHHRQVSPRTYSTMLSALGCGRLLYTDSYFWINLLSWNVILNCQQRSVSLPCGVYYFFSNCNRVSNNYMNKSWKNNIILEFEPSFSACRFPIRGNMYQGTEKVRRVYL